MLHEVDIEAWLAERSITVRRSEREMLFEHPGGSKSLLPLSLGYTRPVDSPALVEFFEKFDGGFIGDGFLLIGTPDEPVTTSTGIVIPSLEEIRLVSEGQGIVFDDGDVPFMTTAYMFVYAFSRDRRLRCYDRDFGAVTEDQTIAHVLNCWWTMKETENTEF